MNDDILNLVSLVIDKKPTDFEAQVREMLNARAADFIERARIDIASNLYGGEVTESTEVDPEDEDDLFDLDDLDLDNLEEVEDND